MLLWLLLHHPRYKTANTASRLLLQHGIYQLLLERWCFLQSGCQLADQFTTAGQLGFLLCCYSSTRSAL
jgi:hypothetical protein